MFPSGPAKAHYNVCFKSIEVMSKILCRDIYGLGAPGILIEHVQRPDLDPLNKARYACRYWADHFIEWNSIIANCKTGSYEEVLIGQSPMKTSCYLDDSGPVHTFLQKHFLNWLEALSLLGQVPSAILMLSRLRNMLNVC